MSGALAASFLVSSLLRSCEQRGGFGMVLSKGDARAGAILVVCRDRGQLCGLSERLPAQDFRYRWQPTGPQDIEDGEQLDHYIQRRRRSDPDLWVVELDIANPERLIAEWADEA
jgi:hypothetical protein